jgi:hypothetical protein
VRTRKYHYRAENGSFLDDDTMIKYAPSIFNNIAFPELSDSYKHIPTSKIITALRNNGFEPVEVSQSGDTNSIRSLFAKHVVRFRKTEISYKNNDIVPEILLKNSHDGKSSYNITAGLFRIICLNGLVAGVGDLFNIKVPHNTSGEIISHVLDATNNIVKKIPELFERVDKLKEKKLDEYRRYNLAKNIIDISPSNLIIDPSEYLVPRRSHDMGYDAWTTMNVIQENVIRGGVLGQDRLGSKRRTMAIFDVSREIEINRKIWDLAEAA